MSPKNVSLVHLLTQYDIKLSAKERIPNIFRLGNFLKAAKDVENFMSQGISAEISVVKFFDVDLPPVKKWLEQAVKQVHSQNAE